MRYKFKKKKYIKSSNLEKKFAILLRSFGLEYKQQHRVGYKYYDFYLPKYNIIIEVMGDYWHGNKKIFPKLSKMQLENKKNDIYKKKLAIACNYVFLEFWEHIINNNPVYIKRKILESINEI